MKIDFDRYRRSDGTLKLYDMFRENPPNEGLSQHQMEMAKTIFKAMEGIKRINSRQVAAVALVSVGTFLLLDSPKWNGMNG